MGGAADSLANLVRLPTGCGEQNLVNLAPSVFILRYLKVTQRFAPTLTAKATKYIKKGERLSDQSAILMIDSLSVWEK